MMTTMPGVFVAGDVHRGVTFFVVDAIGEGHRVASHIDQYLEGGSKPDDAIQLDKGQYRKKEIESRLGHASQGERAQIASIPIQERIRDFREVDLAFTEEQANAEAQRCLVCGPCSECLACVQVCKAGAISHNQRERSATLGVRAVIHADHGKKAMLKEVADAEGVFCVTPDDPLAGSAAAGLVMARIGKRLIGAHRRVVQTSPPPSGRIGAFICECGDQISSVIDTERVRKQIAKLPGVTYAGVLPFSCSAEGAEFIKEVVESQNLDRAVLAACSCCSADQACYSCTYQRLRCRQHLGVLPGSEGRFPDLEDVNFAFVNIREQCAWVHADDPRKGTTKAINLIAGAVAGLNEAVPGHDIPAHAERSVLVLGRGKAAAVSKRLFKSFGIPVEHASGFPARVSRTNGSYLAVGKDRTWKGGALVLAPRDADEAERLLVTFGEDGLRPRLQEEWGGVTTHRPGVYFCDPALDANTAGSAAAARAGSWLTRVETRALVTAEVDKARCRACGTCVELCEFGAPELAGEAPNRAARIDPIICVGCGTCVAHCPSDALHLTDVEGVSLEASLQAVLGAGD
jgi:heterodisulfide reductase subunit A-like polyferredoxin